MFRKLAGMIKIPQQALMLQPRNRLVVRFWQHFEPCRTTELNSTG